MLNFSDERDDVAAEPANMEKIVKKRMTAVGPEV